MPAEDLNKVKLLFLLFTVQLSRPSLFILLGTSKSENIVQFQSDKLKCIIYLDILLIVNRHRL